MTYKFNPLLGIGLGDVGATEQDVQDAVQAVEGTASVVTTASATLPADSTGPVAVSLADADFLAVETSIKGLLGITYGTLSRAADGSYSFTSDQSYSSTINFASGTRFATAALPSTFNPLRVGEAELQEDNAYAFYAYVEVDSAGRITRAVRPTGEQYIPKAEIGQLAANSLTVAGLTTGLRSDSLSGGLLGLFESRADGTNYQIYRHYKGIENQLTTQGHNFGISLTDEAGKRILFYTTRNDALGTGASEPYVMDVDGGRQVPALGTNDITLWGDSMSGTFSVSTTQQSFIDAGETDYSRAFRSQGSGGLSSVVIAMQMGVAGWTVEVPGGQINASGNTIVTNNRAAIYTNFATEQGINLDPFAYSNFPAKMPRQVVGGVIGKIQRQTSTSFTTTASGSSAGSTVTVADASGIETGMLVKQTNGNEDKIILGTTVTNINGTTISLSATNLSDLSSDSLDFYYEGGYVFARETAGDAVAINGPQEVAPITNVGFGNDQGYPQTNMEDLLNSIQILWPFGPHGSGGNDPATMEMIVLEAMINKGITALSKKYVMLNAVSSSTLVIQYAQDNGTIVRTTDDLEQAYFDNYGDRYLSIINTSLNGDPSLPIDNFKTWFSTNYPGVYASDPDYGWNVPGGSNVYRQTTTSGVTGVTLVGNGGNGVQSATSVDTTTTGTGLALRLGVVASGGVATAIWVREPGFGYAVSDTVTIPAGTIGNTSDITATVSSIGTSSPGNDVFNQDGSLDVANAYNEWDINNGYMPRVMFSDVVHLSPYGKEFVRLMVAKFILNQNW